MPKNKKITIKTEVVNGKCPTCDQFTMTKNPFPFKTEVVTGECDHCKLTTLLVGIDGTFFRCISCGEDLEQKVNGVIKYIKVDKHTDLTPTNG